MKKKDEVQDKAELKIGPIAIKLNTKQITVIVMLILLSFTILFMDAFPKYQSSIYGNQSVPLAYKHIFVFMPIGILGLFAIILFLVASSEFIKNKNN
ncbi:MAG: hypothetical protein NT129_00360 [Candidatus Aenigmarchaeota archaeon]|nr:hypothetical protein [Candidatus Aenigmarchaeota archaeon]